MSMADPLYSAGSMNKFPVDLQEILKYEELINQISGISPMNGPYYMMMFLKGLEMAGQVFARAAYEYEQAKDMAKRRYSIVRLDYAPTILKERGLRVNEAGMDSVADQDQEYLQAKNKEAYYKAMMSFYKMKVDKFQRAHDDAKKIYDQSKDPRGSMSAMPSSTPDTEGPKYE